MTSSDVVAWIMDVLLDTSVEATDKLDMVRAIINMTKHVELHDEDPIANRE